MRSEYAHFVAEPGNRLQDAAISCSRHRLRDLVVAWQRPHFVELGEVARDRSGFSADEKPGRTLAGVVCRVRHTGWDVMGLAGREPDRRVQPIGLGLENLHAAFEHVNPCRAAMTLRAGSVAVGRDHLDQVEWRDGI